MESYCVGVQVYWQLQPDVRESLSLLVRVDEYPDERDLEVPRMRRVVDRSWVHMD